MSLFDWQVAMFQASSSTSEIQSLSILWLHHHQPVASQASKFISAWAWQKGKEHKASFIRIFLWTRPQNVINHFVLSSTGQNPVTWSHLTLREPGKCNIYLCKGRRNRLGEQLDCFCHWSVLFSKSEPISYVNELLENLSRRKEGWEESITEKRKRTMEDKNSVLITSLIWACLKHNFQLSNAQHQVIYQLCFYFENISLTDLWADFSNLDWLFSHLLHNYHPDTFLHHHPDKAFTLLLFLNFF